MVEGESYNIKTILLGAAGIILGLLLVLLAENLARETYPVWRGLIETTAVSFLVGGYLGLGYEFLLRREVLRGFDRAIDRISSDMAKLRADIDQRVKLSSSIDALGLFEICEKESSFDYTDIITTSKSLVFLFNDGRTWFSSHEHDLCVRAELPNLETTIILINPNSPFIGALSEKVSQTPEELKKKIDETTRMISRIQWNCHKLAVYGHSLPTSFSLVMSEDKAVFIPYPVARKADRIPCYVFSARGGDGYYASIRRDIDALIAHAGTTRLHPPSLV